MTDHRSRQGDPMGFLRGQLHQLRKQRRALEKQCEYQLTQLERVKGVIVAMEKSITALKQGKDESDESLPSHPPAAP